jgi:hypothetical protein
MFALSRTHFNIVIRNGYEKKLLIEDNPAIHENTAGIPELANYELLQQAMGKQV